MENITSSTEPEMLFSLSLSIPLLSLAFGATAIEVEVDTRLQPIFHTPGQFAVGFSGDPNGMFYSRDTDLYHFFWQCSEGFGDDWSIQWCHRTSKDMVSNWKVQPNALTDKGSFSGAATTLENGEVVMLNIVTSLDWRMYTSKPTDPANDAELKEWTRSDIPTNLTGFTDVSGGTLIGEPNTNSSYFGVCGSTTDGMGSATIWNADSMYNDVKSIDKQLLTFPWTPSKKNDSPQPRDPNFFKIDNKTPKVSERATESYIHY